MKFNNLKKTEDGKIVNVDLEFSDEENQFFVALAFNTLLQQGAIRLNEQTKLVEFSQPPVVQEEKDNGKETLSNS